MSEQVVLFIGGSSSQCGACREGCDPREETHTQIYGYGSRNGMAGCGARYTHVCYTYGIPGRKENKMRPDLEILDGT